MARNQFQKDVVRDIARREGFEQWVTPEGGLDYEGNYEGPFCCVFYQNGKLCLVKVGRSRILRELKDGDEVLV